MLRQLGRALLLAVLLLRAMASTSVVDAVAADAPPRPRQSVLYIIVDDLRPELGYSQPQRKGLSTPNVDALATKSMIFDRAFIQQGVCGPTRNSFMSGRRPGTTRAWNFKSSFRDAPGGAAWTALPQAFKQAGYLSGAIRATFPNISRRFLAFFLVLFLELIFGPILARSRLRQDLSPWHPQALRLP